MPLVTPLDPDTDPQTRQLASFFNGAESFGGLQIALVNYTKDLQGLQLGIINIIANGGDIFGLPIFPFVNFDF